MKLEIDMPEHHYNNIIAFDPVSLGRVSYKGIIMYAINAIKRGKALDQEPTAKNDLGVDCISREQAINAVNMCSNSETILNLQQLPSITPQEPVKKLEEQIKQLQNRCHALTHGQICVFCLYECEHKAESEVEDGECK